MRRAAVWLAVAAGVALGGAPALAQEGTSPWMGTIHAGYSKIMENEDDAVYSVPGGGLALHGNVFRMLDPVLGVGLELGYQHYGEEAFEIPSSGALEEGQRGDAGFCSLHLSVQGIARGVRGTWRPYGTLGLGWYSLRATLSGQLLLPDGTPIPNSTFEDEGSESKFGANLGGGVLFKPSASSLGFSLEARWHTIFDGWATTDGTAALDVMTLMAGIHFN